MDNQLFFKKNGYLVLRGVLSKDILELLTIQTKLDEKIKCFEKNKNIEDYFFHDCDTPYAYTGYSMLCYESLLEILQPLIEEHINIELLPTYSYFRIYYKNAKLRRHIDREACEYSASICIDCQGQPWDIYIKNYENKEECITLNKGDILIYKGSELEHWRNVYEGNQQIQAFLHYIDKNGQNINKVFDNRPFIGLPPCYKVVNSFHQNK